MRPIKKLETAGIAGAFGVVVVYLAKLAEIELPPEVAAALVSVVTWLAAYLQRDPLVDAGKAARQNEP